MQILVSVQSPSCKPQPYRLPSQIRECMKWGIGSRAPKKELQTRGHISGRVVGGWMEREGHIVCQGQRWLSSVSRFPHLTIFYFGLFVHSYLCLCVLNLAQMHPLHKHTPMGSQPRSLTDYTMINLQIKKKLP